jgi:hypothetical protein
MDEQKIVILHGFSPEEALAAMRAIKGAIPSVTDAAFATSTETNMNWKLKELLDHVSKEHRLYMDAAKAKKN